MSFGLTSAESVRGIDAEASGELSALLDVAARTSARNHRLSKFYEGDYEVRSVGVSTVPKDARVPECCGWPRKAVTCVSERSRFEGFAFESGEDDPALSYTVDRSGLAVAYSRNVDSQLTHGCMFATVGRDAGGAVVRMHTAESAAATWDPVEGRIASGLVVADVRRTPWSPRTPVPVQLNMHLPDRIVVLRRIDAASWRAESMPHPMGRPLMEAFTFRATGTKPFGQTRITKTVRTVAADVVRTLQDMAVSAAFYAAPQKWLMGITEDQYDQLVENKWSTYIGSVLLGTLDPDTGHAPTAGQFSAASPQPYIDLLRTYAQIFSAETGVPINSLGIVQDNPSSADAIQASREDICMVVEDLNASNALSLRAVALMAMAVANDTDLDGLTDEQRTVTARFRSPLMTTLSARADAATKMAAADADFAGSPVYYETMGFDGPTVRRIVGEKARARAQERLSDVFGRMTAGAANEADASAD